MPFANPSVATFPAATNARQFWGGGFQLGTLFRVNEKWNLGFSYKSPVWQERWHYNASYPNLAPRRIGVQASLPEIFSWGVAYKGLPKTLIAVDLRYVDYANSELFGQKIIDGGLAWRSVFAVATQSVVFVFVASAMVMSTSPNSFRGRMRPRRFSGKYEKWTDAGG